MYIGNIWYFIGKPTEEKKRRNQKVTHFPFDTHSVALTADNK